MARLTPVPANSWPAPQEASGFEQVFYLAQEGDDGPIKAGIARHPTRRLTALRVGNPRQLLLRAVYSGTRVECLILEAGVINHFEQYRIRGEWLSADLRQILEFVDSYISDAD